MSQEHWENYYRGGALATAPMDGERGFDQEIAEAWESFFHVLPDSAVVLDIGTGNGIVLAFASALARRLRRQWALYGTDLAQINPTQDVPSAHRLFSNCRFYPGVASENLPFEADAFDAVCGHYALEYSDIEVSVSELARVLKPGGVGQFILHHTESELVTNARKSLATADFLIGDIKIYQRLRAFAEVADERARVGSPTTTGLRTAIQQAKEKLNDASGDYDRYLLAVVLDAVGHLLVSRPRDGMPYSLKEIARAESDLRSSVKRLRDLVSVAVSEAEIQRLVLIAAQNSLVCEEPQHQIHGGKALVGWRLRFVAA